MIVLQYEMRRFVVGVNGQTGEVAANLPIDKKKQDKVVRIFTAIGIGLGVLLFALLCLAGNKGWAWEWMLNLAFSTAVGIPLAIWFSKQGRIWVNDSMVDVAEAQDLKRYTSEHRVTKSTERSQVVRKGPFA